MVRALRRHQKKILLVLGISLAVIWGSAGIMSRLVSRPAETAGKIFGRKVSLEEFESNATRWMAWLGPERAQREIVWERLILLDEARRAGLKVSDEEVRRGIEAIIMRGRSDVPFDETTYQFFLQIHNLRPEDFEETVREARLIQKLRRTVTDAAIVTESQLLDRFKKENEKIKAKYIILPSQDFIDQAKEPEEAEILEFYEANAQERYRQPEKVRVEYVAAFYDHLAQKVELSQEEINTYYQEQKEDYKIIEQPPEEEERREEDSSSDEAQPGDSENEALPAGRQASEEESGQPPTTSAQYRPLDEVAAEIETILREDKAPGRANTLIIRAANDLDAAERPDFEAIAKKHGLSYIAPDFFSRAQATNLLYIGDSAGYDKKRFVDEVFGMLDGFKQGEDEISRIMMGSQGNFVFRIIAQVPPLTQGLDEVRQEIIKELKSKGALEAARSHADSLWQKMGESSFEEIAQVQGLEIKETEFVTRRTARTDSLFVEPAFDIEMGQIATPSIYEDKVYLVKVEAREDADETQFDEQRETLRFFVSWEETLRLYRQWLAHLRSRANLVDYKVQKEEKEEPGRTQ